MTLAAEYRQQFGWRSWNLIFQQLPLRWGQTVLDMGCGIGDQARELGARGCEVIGLDANEELINEATSAKPINCEFRTCDLRDLPELGIRADGIWCSFAGGILYESSGVAEAMGAVSRDWRLDSDYRDR